MDSSNVVKAHKNALPEGKASKINHYYIEDMAVFIAVIVKRSYCPSDRWNSFILSFWAPIHSGLL